MRSEPKQTLWPLWCRQGMAYYCSQVLAFPIVAGHQGYHSGNHTSLTCCIRVKPYAQVLREQL